MTVLPFKKPEEVARRERRRLPKANREAARPYRIWYPKERHFLAYRCYGSAERALEGACLLAHAQDTGHKKLGLFEALEVINIRYNRHLGTFVHTVSGGVKFYPPKSE